MKPLIQIVVALLVLQACEGNSREQKVPVHQQALIALTPSWDSLAARVYSIEWDGNQWLIQAEHAAVVGENGLGWGTGVKDFTDRSGPVKQEGDKKSPAGVFAIGTAFGKVPADSLPGLRLPYQRIVAALQCIEDTSSDYYNHLMLDHDPVKDWEQGDHMLREDHIYDIGAFVQHNTNPAIPGGGSCIFLHLWRKADSGTLGCTAMSRENLMQHLLWLDPEKQPVLVQVPIAEYPAIAREFSLPGILR